MKTLINITAVLAIMALLFAFSYNKGNVNVISESALKDTSGNYLDGTYNGQSQSTYTTEPFWGHIRITVDGGFFTSVKFAIRDSTLHENVDSMYGVNHYSGNAEYMQQCVNEEHGIAVYPQNLTNSQDLDNVDAYTGASATWSYNIFIASAKDALKNAKKPSAVNTTDDETKIKVFPNPFYSSLVIHYYMAKNDFVNLSIYDEQGKLINQLVNEMLPAGDYFSEWIDCPNDGVYYYRFQTNTKVLSKKIVRLSK